MACSVAVSNSPVFSPSSSLFCSKASETLTLSLNHHHLKSSSPSSPSSPKSPFRIRLQKPPTGLSSSSSSSSTSSSNLVSGNGVSVHTSAAILKRKRPTKLDIPLSSMCLAAPVMTPTVALSEIEREGDGYSVYCKKGRREAMEDRYSAVVDLQGDSKQAFFGVFDGHGGAKAAEFASRNLDRNIINEISHQNEDEDLENAIKNGYLKTDADFLKEDTRGGACCVTALIRKGNLVVSNAGDCRAVLSKAGVAEALTSDHRPSREDERDRIISTGGYVDLCRGVWRIQGSLAVSRGIGDKQLKQWVIAEPETKIVKIETEDEFLILASDGLWDKVSNQEAVDIARPLCVGLDKPSPLVACKKLVDLSVLRGSIDDISVMLVQLSSYRE